ncbi:MAG: NAD(+) diphosphatase [Bacteroidales bacterium]|nr:NAD(+) diphosphatase [Bacteroidales bacterium]MBN2819862.1 NAD(+) diphosphatase [Bacteroidales bacterium]
MIHEIAPHHFNNDFQAGIKLSEEDYILLYEENAVLLKRSEGILELPRKKDFASNNDDWTCTFLFSFNGVPCFLLQDKILIDEPNLGFEDLGFFRSTKQNEIAWICMVGFHLLNWYRQNKFCGKCGSETRHKEDERATICPKCNHVVYPKISPAIIVAITCGDKILLARGTHYKGTWYSLVAGYADVGESLEETVRREVKEEVGLDVTNIRYYKSQPWPLSGSMMIGFFAEADDNQPLSIDKNEIAEAAWFEKGNLPAYSSIVSIAGEMIDRFEKGQGV